MAQKIQRKYALNVQGVVEINDGHITIAIEDKGEYDLVVAGGGVAGMCASVASSRMGAKVALINDRPIWGGCNSSEIRVHLGGHIDLTDGCCKIFSAILFSNITKSSRRRKVRRCSHLISTFCICNYAAKAVTYSNTRNTLTLSIAQSTRNIHLCRCRE
mgnify:CR=1 FL=1